MNFKIRFLILATVNCSLLLLVFYVLSQTGTDFAQTRLIDLQLDNPLDRKVFFEFLTLMIGAFGVNFLVGVGKTSFSKHEVEALIEIIKHSKPS